MNVNG